MKRKMKQLLGILLSLALVLGLMPGMSLTAYADGTTYNPASTYTGFGDLISNDTEVTISEVSGKTWYVIANDSSTVTLLSKESFGNHVFNSNLSAGNVYANSEIKTYVDGLTGEGQPLAGISSVISDLTLIDLETAQGLSETKKKGAGANWWLRSPGNDGLKAAVVVGGSGSVYASGSEVRNTLGVRPALQLDLSKVTFDSVTNTFSLAGSTTPAVTISPSDEAGTVKAEEIELYHNEYWRLTATAAEGYKFVKWTFTYDGSAGQKFENPYDLPKDTIDQITGLTAVFEASNKESAIPATVAANNHTYDGTEKPLVTVTGEPTGGEMRYALGTATEATEPYTTSIPAKTNAGTYYVWYKAVGDETHIDSEADYVTVTIKAVQEHQHMLEYVEAKEPDCETNGYKKHYKCTECGKIFEDATGIVELTEKDILIAAIGHKWDDGEVTKEATYDEEGVKTYTCQNDSSHTKEESIPKKTRPSESNSDRGSSSSDSGSSGDSGSSSKISSASQALVDQVNNVSSGNVPANHQVETGVPASDVGGRWANDPNADIWTYTKSDGTLAKSEWLSLDYNGLRYWYYFDGTGNMQTNWFDYNGKRYYLMPEKDGWRGRMATGWKQIDNKWYYFDITPGSTQGSMYMGTVTPDGHVVGADGAWNGVGDTPVGQE